MSGKAFWTIFILLYITMIFPAAVGIALWLNPVLRRWLSEGSPGMKGRLIAGVGVLVLIMILLVGLPLYPPD